MKPDLNPVISSTPTGGLELNFSLNREKANQINEREVPDQGLNPDESLHQVYLPTGGTSRLFEDDFPLKYSLLNAFSESVFAHCSSGLYQFRSFKAPFSTVKTDGCVETICSSKLYHQSGQNPLGSKLEQPSVSAGQGSSAHAGRGGQGASVNDVPSQSDRCSPRRSNGLIVRGRTFYVRWMIPRRLQETVGRTHFVKSLRTGRWDDAVRQARTYYLR